MLAVGSHGRDGFEGLVLGSVSHAVLHHAHCPLRWPGPETVCLTGSRGGQPLPSLVNDLPAAQNTANP